MSVVVDGRGWNLEHEHAQAGARLLWPTSYARPDAEGFVGTLLRGFEELVTVERTEIPQPWNGIVVFDSCYRGPAIRSRSTTRTRRS